MDLFSIEFWTTTLRKSIRTFAQALVGILAAAGTGIGFGAISWPEALSAAGLAAAACVLWAVVDTKTPTERKDLAVKEVDSVQAKRALIEDEPTA